MKKYKILESSNAELITDQMNELAADGYELVSHRYAGASTGARFSEGGMHMCIIMVKEY